jgi:Tfp pilus assembly protein PilP
MQAKKRQPARVRNKFAEKILFFILSAALLFLNACSEKPQAPEAIQSRTKAAGKINIEKQKNDNASVVVNALSEEPYSYNPNGKVDPFVAGGSESVDEELLGKKADEKKPEQEVPITPLQKLDVDDFTLVAVISTTNGLCALIEDPSMNGFTIKEGMQIGKKAGIVKKILYNSVIIEEQGVNDQGSSDKKIKTLTLRKK